MKFGPASPRDAIGGVTVHTLRQGPLVLKKGTRIGDAEVAALEKAGVKEVVVVRLDAHDVSEDAAAASIAQAVAGEGVNVERAFTARSNLFAARPGILVVDKREDGGYVTPIECVGEDATYISRVRKDPTVEHGLNMWIVSDNLRKGAALNAVQIAESLVNRNLLRAA